MLQLLLMVHWDVPLEDIYGTVYVIFLGDLRTEGV